MEKKEVSQYTLFYSSVCYENDILFVSIRFMLPQAFFDRNVIKFAL